MIIKNPEGKTVSLEKIVESDGKVKLVLRISRDNEYQISVTLDELEAKGVAEELVRLFLVDENAEPCLSTKDGEVYSNDTNFYNRWKAKYSFDANNFAMN